jgi:hypothetical protein
VKGVGGGSVGSGGDSSDGDSGEEGGGSGRGGEDGVTMGAIEDANGALYSTARDVEEQNEQDEQEEQEEQEEQLLIAKEVEAMKEYWRQTQMEVVVLLEGIESNTSATLQVWYVIARCV